MLIIDEPPSAPEEPSVAHDASVQYRGDKEDGGPKGKVKGKEKAVMPEGSEVVTDSEIPPDELVVDWTKYDPPESLRYVGDVESDMIIHIIEESIRRIEARIREQEEQQLAAEAAGRREEEEEEAWEQDTAEAEREGNDDAPPNSTQPDAGQDESPAQGHVAPAASSCTSDFPESPKRPRKRMLMNRFWKLHSDPEHGESSATGAIRHRLPRLMIHPSSVGMATHSARKRLVVGFIKKAAGEDASTSTTPPIQEPEVECVSCLDDFNPQDTVQAPCHNYCMPCFQRLVASACKDEQRWPPKCCLNNIPESTILANIDEQQRTEYRGRAAEWSVPAAERIYCSQPHCSLFIPRAHVDAARGVARCPGGGHETCVVCRGAGHSGDGDCPQDRELARTATLAEALGWRRCHGCRAYVEHRDACQHMTCRCGAQFCYVCGAPWRTCGCTPGQLARVKLRAEAAGREAAERAALEDDAVREAVRVVEAFVREEARRAEEERRERVRFLEERRVAELQRRIRAETARRRAVAAEFEGMRAAVAALHEEQKALQAQAQAERRRRFEACERNGLARFREVQALEREARREETEARLAERDAQVRREYAARGAEERRIEEQYVARLRAYWAGRAPQGEEGEEGEVEAEVEVQTALRQLRRRMDAGFGVWRAWADAQLDAHAGHLEREMAVFEAQQQEAEQHGHERVREGRAALEWRGAAEVRWMDEAAAARARMLAEMEVEALREGEDREAWFEMQGRAEDAVAMVMEVEEVGVEDNPWVEMPMREG
ncbi:hypothetical protein F4802DRAFT_616687 [Xylaria palmicola]|nr:hypothetical protein F4802DRAFT_616687 [Xylaria palmicola]